MLTVTERAIEYLLEKLSEKEEGTPEALRIVRAEDGFHFTMDDAKDGDQIFEQEGRNYLLMDADVSEALSNASLDVHESPQGMRITLSIAREPGPVTYS